MNSTSDVEHRRPGEPVGELGDDPVGEGVGHLEDVGGDVGVLGDAGFVVTGQLGGGLGQGLVEVAAHHVLEGVDGPCRVGAGEELGDLVGVGVPGGAAILDLGVVAGLGGGDEVTGDEDVVTQERFELRSGLVAVEPGDGVADVGLVLQEPGGGGVGVGQVGDGADDEQPRPGHVVLPEHADVPSELHGVDLG